MKRTLTNLLPELPRAKGANEIKSEPKTNSQKEIEATIGRDASQFIKLNPPVFADATETIRARQPKINRLFNDIIRVL